VHAKNPKHGSPEYGPLAQPARATIATASSALNNHRPLSLISEYPARIAEITPRDRLAVWQSRGRRAMRPHQKYLSRVFEKTAEAELEAIATDRAANFQPTAPYGQYRLDAGRGHDRSQGRPIVGRHVRASTLRLRRSRWTVRRRWGRSHSRDECAGDRSNAAQAQTVLWAYLWVVS
jgi:hypothetical protein